MTAGREPRPQPLSAGRFEQPPLASAPSAEAGITYSGIRNLGISLSDLYPLTSTSELDIDLDTNGIDDFRFRILGSRQHYFPYYRFFPRNIGLTGGALVGYGAIVSNLPTGISVVPPFSSNGLFLRTSGGVFLSGEFDTSGLAGMHFQIGADTHYGWIRLQAGATGFGHGFLTVVDWAYETTPDTLVHAGVVPEPSALSLLALGTVGLGFYRRHRKRLAGPAGADDESLRA